VKLDILGSKFKPGDQAGLLALFWFFLSQLPGKCWDHTQIMPSSLPSKSFKIHYSLSIVSFDATAYNMSY
jgi:hypothetical protein